MKKQTAVEWLIDELPHLDIELIRPIIEQAKAMEKEQIVEAWDNGFEEMPYKNGKQYYNETYEQEN